MSNLITAYASEGIKTLTLGVASPEEILARSYGRVSNPNTFDVETNRPITGGLLCPKIFGLRPGEMCLCVGGKASNEEFCLNCGVDFVSQSNAHSRFGHIDLAVPIVHTWFYKTTCSLITLVTGLKDTEVKDIVLCNKHLIKTSVGNYRKGKLVSTNVLLDLYKRGKGNNVVSGGKAMMDLVTNANINRIKENLTKRLQKAKTFERIKKLKEDFLMIEGIASGNIKLERLGIYVLQVLPSALRPKVCIKPNVYVDSALTDLYSCVVSANNAILAVANLEKSGITCLSFLRKIRALQIAIDSLIDSAEDVTKEETTESISLTGLLKGKGGHFRRVLLGRRVDYSGRTVIAPGPELKLDECSVPITMAAELFKPLVLAKLNRINKSTGGNCVKQTTRKDPPRYVSTLRKISRGYPVILNRAPTLHKLSILAFKMKLADEKVIRLHPLVCFGFNADFDGDQMAIHIPLSEDARREAGTLLIASRNVLHPANGKCTILPTKDIVLGIYYVSLISEEDHCGEAFMNLEDASAAMIGGMIKLHTAIYVYDNSKWNIIRTTVGRLLITKLLPDKCAFAYSTEMPCMDKKQIEKLVNRVYESCGRKQTVEFCERLMKLGLKFVSNSGLSIGGCFLKEINDKKQSLWKVARDIVNKSTDGDMRKVCNVWRKYISEANGVFEDTFNDWNGGKTAEQVIVKSGAAGSAVQMGQLMIAKADAYSFSGRQCKMPITASYYEGLSPMQMFYSTHVARRGLIDTALKTAASGYFARKLIEVARECIVTETDCNTLDGINYRINEDINENQWLIKGRFLTQSITLRDGNVVSNDKMITEAEVSLLSEVREEIMIRSPITCLSERGVCSKCYGINLGTGTVAEIGDSVGTIAAEAISEPGTQMTLRTFHGLTKKSKANERLVRKPIEEEVKLEKIACERLKLDEKITNGGCMIKGAKRTEVARQRTERLSNHSFDLVKETCEVALKRTQNVYHKKKIQLYSKSNDTKVATSEESSFTTGRNWSSQISVSDEVPSEIIASGQPKAVIGNESEDVNFVEQNQGLTCLNKLFDGKPNEIISNLLEFDRTEGQFTSITGDDFACPSLKIIGLLESDGEIESLLSERSPAEDLFDLNAFVNLFVKRVLLVYSSYGINLHAQHVEIILQRMLGFVVVYNSEGIGFMENKWEVIRKLNYKRAKLGEQTLIGTRRLINVTKACERYGSQLANISFGKTAVRLAKSAMNGRPILLNGVKDAIIVGKTPMIGKTFH
ncbi:MAG: hypothetical protein ACTS4V_01850, partial [Candidatus Hodgkinia cicadicola]